MTELRVNGLTVRFGVGERAMTAVDSVDLEVPAGRVVGLVGESGSGKSTLARAVVGLVPATAGTVTIDGERPDRVRAARRRELRRRVQMVFQDPFASLNPRMTVGDAIAEAITTHHRTGRAERAKRVTELLDMVALDPGHATRLPRELSGGQRQRVAIARALAVQPEVLIADEITSALDVSVQGAVLNLLRDIRSRLGLSVLFISHNLALVRHVSDVIAVMYLGRVVEVAPTEELVARPRHPYTRALLDAVPTISASRPAAPAVLDEDPADPHHPPAGCHFHPRCPLGPATHGDRQRCATEDPRIGAGDRPHLAACHFPIQPPTSPLRTAR